MSDKDLRELERREALDGDEATLEAAALARCRVGKHDWSNWTTDYEWRQKNWDAETRLMKYLRKRACFWCFKIDYERVVKNHASLAPCGRRSCILAHDDDGNHYSVDVTGNRTSTTQATARPRCGCGVVLLDGREACGNCQPTLELTWIGAGRVTFPPNIRIDRIRFQSRVEPDTLIRITEVGSGWALIDEAWIYESGGSRCSIDVAHVVRDRTVFEIDISPAPSGGGTVDDITTIFDYVSIPPQLEPPVPAPIRCGVLDATGLVECERPPSHAGDHGTYHGSEGWEPRERPIERVLWHGDGCDTMMMPGGMCPKCNFGPSMQDTFLAPRAP